jgi:Effector-associated domain 11
LCDPPIKHWEKHMDATQIERWLAEAKTEKVLAELLRPDSGLDPDLRYEATLLSARFKNLERAKRAGTLAFNDENVARAAIHAALLEVVRRLPDTDALPNTTELTIVCTTEKGRENPQFHAGESLRLFFKTNQACLVRAIYQLADGRPALLDDDRAVPETHANRWLEIGDGFEVDAPFGTERLFVFAQRSPFAPLATRDEDGYRFLNEPLTDSLQKTRGLKKKTPRAEDSLNLTTLFEATTPNHP